MNQAKRCKKPVADQPSPKYFIVEIENCNGDDTQIAVRGGRNYAVGKFEETRGVIVLVDWSYRSAEEAATAWPEFVFTTIDGRLTRQVKFSQARRSSYRGP